MKILIKNLAKAIKEKATVKFYKFQSEKINFDYETPCGAIIGVTAVCNFITGEFHNDWDYENNRLTNRSFNVDMILNENSIEMPNVTNALNELLN